jgi:hypothetical protein
MAPLRKNLRRSWVSVLLCLPACLCVPTLASASTATLVAVESTGGTGFRYVAAAGETNRLELTASAAGGVITVVATDPGATVTPGQGCTADGVHSVRCQYDLMTDIYLGLDAQLTLSDGSDSAKLLFERSKNFYPGATLRGEQGDDRLDMAAANVIPNTSVSQLRGGPGDDLLIGGGGDDDLDGGGGHDELHGGGGFNRLSDGDRTGSVDADVLDGGGKAFLDYGSRTKPLRIDLRSPGADGQRGEGDRVSGVTGVVGGHGKDVLSGTRGPNVLQGGGGSDRLYGRAGDDGLYVSSSGVAVGGHGDDTIIVLDGGPAEVVCGPGGDEVLWNEEPLGAGPWLSRSCEQIDAGESEFALRIRPPRPLGVSRDGRLVFHVPCRAPRACRQRLTITRPRPPFAELGSRRFTTPKGGRQIAIPVPAQVVQQARRRPLRLRVEFDGVILREETSFALRYDL